MPANRTILKISSSHLKDISKLKLKKYRDEKNGFLIETEKVLTEALLSDWKVREIYLTRENLNLIKKWESFKNFENCDVFELSLREFEKISSETTPSGVAAFVEKKKFNLSNLFTRTNIICTFDRISDPGNLGTIIRSADWFGLSAIVLSQNSVEFTNPKVIRASMGSIFHLEIFQNIELKHFLKDAKGKGYFLIGAKTKGKSLVKYEFTEKLILVFGNESTGLSSEVESLCDDFVTIPSSGSAESLNLAISASIIFYEIRRRIGIKHASV